jgi:hypothetical protein
MEDPAHLAALQMSALFDQSRALSVGDLGAMRARSDRPVVQIRSTRSPTDDPDRQEFQIVTTRGEPGDPHYHQSVHGCMAFKVYDDGYNDAVLMTLSLMSPLHRP